MRTLALLWSGEPIRGKGHRDERRTAHRRLPLLLLAYLVDHLDLHLSFAIAAVTSVALVVSYLRVVVGTQFALREAGLAQLVFLVFFSYAFFFEGYTGLTVTAGAIVTLFVLMQLTAKVDWGVVLARRETA